MTGEFAAQATQPATPAQAFTADIERIAQLWPAEFALAMPGAPLVPPEEARRFATALAAALDDDLAPLTGLAGLDRRADTAGMPHRLDAVLRALDAVRRVAGRVSGPHVAGEVGAVARQLAVHAAATLAARAAAAEERAASTTTSLAVTMHELRRPLTIMSSYTQLLSAGAMGELGERPTTAVAAMSSATETMMRLVESLGAVSRLEDPGEPAEIRDVPLEHVVAAAEAEVENEAELKGVTLHTHVDDGLRVRGEHERLALAVTNLLSNAVKHAPPQTAVEVAARRLGTAARITVRDHGPGFSEKVAERLFEKYYRAPSERENQIPGTGLGLYIVRTVADRHSGTVEARRPPDGGAEFALTIPALPG